MAKGRPPKVDHLRVEFFRNLDSYQGLVDSVMSLSGIKANASSARTLHPEYARRCIELAFLGLVSAWEEFLEQTFVRYLAGAKTDSGRNPSLRLGRAANIPHAYQVLSGNVDYDPAKHYSKFGEPKWVIASAKLYFSHDGAPYADPIQFRLDALQHAVRLRNRVAHNSTKTRSDFKASAQKYLGLNAQDSLRKGFGVGDLLVAPADRIFGNGGNASINYFEAHRLLYRKLALVIVPV